MIYPENVAERIRALRIRNNMTQAQLAEKMYVTPQTVSKWEKSLAMPDLQKLGSLCDILSCDINDILANENPTDDCNYIAIDGGGTKTEFLLFNANGNILHRVILGGSNPNVCGFDAACAVLKQGIDEMFGITSNIKGIFGGIAGSIPGENKMKLTSFLKKKYPSCKILVEIDIQNVIYSGTSLERGIAGIIGTGMVVYDYSDGKIHRAGGWGYLFDGAGSGYDIGRDAISYCFACDDGFTARTPLVELVEVRLNGRASDSMDKIYAKGKDYIASFCPLVFRAFEMGDKEAEKIIRKNLSRLAHLIDLVYDRYHSGNNVILAGGLAKDKEFIEPILKELLKSDVKIEFSSRKPVFGACRRALHAFGTEYDYNTFVENYDKDYRRLTEND